MRSGHLRAGSHLLQLAALAWRTQKSCCLLAASPPSFHVLLLSVTKGAGMARWLRLLAATSVACLLGTMVYAEELKVGDKAPDFKLQGSDGKTYSLADLKGKTVVLAWFPKAFTGG